MSFAVGQYQVASVETASPGRVLLMLYEGAVRFLRQGQAAAQAGRHAERGKALHRAHAIVSELRATLDHEKAPDLCGDLDRLYDFVLDRIARSTTEKRAEPLDAAIKVLTELRDGWAQAVEQTP